MGNIKELFIFFCLLSVVFPLIYCEKNNEKKIHFKIELLDNDFLLSNDHLKKEKSIFQGGNKLKIKTFEKIQGNILERAIVVEQVNKLKSGNVAEDDISLEDSSSDDTDSNNGVKKNNMKVISSEESEENDIHMLRKVYQKTLPNITTTYCYIRYTFNLNLEKLSESNKSEIFKGIDSSLDYTSFLPKDKINATESTLENEYANMDKSEGSNDSIISNLELISGDIETENTNEEYIKTIDDIIGYFDDNSDTLSVPIAIKNKLMNEKKSLVENNQSERYEDHGINKEHMENIGFYELLKMLKNSFFMTKNLKSVSYNLNEKNDNEVDIEKGIDDIFINSIINIFGCYDTLKKNNKINSIFMSNENNINRYGEIHDHSFSNMSPRRNILNENFMNSNDDGEECESFLQSILQNKIFENDSRVSENEQNMNLGTEMGNQEGIEENYLKSDDSFDNSSNLNILKPSVRNLYNNSNNFDYNNNDNTRELSTMEGISSDLGDIESFTEISDTMRNYDTFDESDENEDEYYNADDEADDEEYDDEIEEIIENNEEIGDNIEESEDYSADDEENEDYNDEQEDYDDEDEDYNDEQEDYGDEDENDDDRDYRREVDENGYDENGNFVEDEDDAINRTQEIRIEDVVGSLLKAGTNKLKNLGKTDTAKKIKKNMSISNLSGKVNGIMGSIKDATKKTISKPKKGISNGINKLKDGMKNNVNTMKEKSKSFSDKAAKAGKSSINLLKNKAKNGIKNVKKGGDKIANKLVKESKNSVDKLKNGAKNGIKDVKKGGDKIVNKLVKESKNSVDKLKNEAKKGVEAVKEKSENIVNKVTKAAKDNEDKLKKEAKKGVEIVKEKTENAIDKVAKVVKNGANKLEEEAKKGVEAVKEKSENAVDKVTKAAKDNGDKLKIEAKKGIESVKEKSEKAIDKAVNVVKDGANKLEKEVKKGVEAVKVKTENTIDKAVKVVKDGAKKIESEAKKGANEAKTKIDKVIDNAEKSAKNVMGKVSTETKNTLGNITKEVEKGIKDNKTEIKTSSTKLDNNKKSDINKTNGGLNKEKGSAKTKDISPATPQNGAKITSANKNSKSKASLLSISDDNNEEPLNKEKIKSEINKIDKEYKKLKKMEKKLNEELKNPSPSDKQIIHEFDEYEKTVEKKNKKI
ncbi:hypothetical protein YYG_01590 [Plasmodium vinckei petteri]|uniref:Secreted ookinete protein n=1 Tax=Plasmodium vinckei petteri TaxID=138298 RepID=W7AY77_PLAVN|nr:hypothetical protein YYG_01590 [Plasmodium vinckei petteri]